MSNLAQRILTGVIGVAAIIFVLWVSPWGAFAFCLIVAIAGLLEFYKITGLLKKPTAWVMLTGALVFMVLGGMGKDLIDFSEVGIAHWAQFGKWAIWAFLLPLTALITLYDKKETDPLGTQAKLVFGFCYTVLPLYLLMDISLPHGNPLPGAGGISPMNGAAPSTYLFQVPLGFMFMVWATDTFAYFGGRFLGKHKLMERISPKKTWEGAISGGLGAILFGAIYGFAFDAPGLAYFLPMGAIVAVFSQTGDLVESMYKRSLKIKDSGGILPGHGGILDRFDGFYVALPFTWLYVLVYLHFLG
jgi:phosphatidate cytidylyltransferase